ncbi:unnamed protein product [Parascedosporium putredinis]|uniref:non-specific serine/threonine protein kinase n=1 Tax=Parascedosporium putredinis TaxID=1442378 RepID=A0A9P1GVG8_9PEZI|nr:unnamed protein product [Parascedosporium putredinis]CAI7988098.1 unnamed protein product [Parascedosporium putredinis]
MTSTPHGNLPSAASHVARRDDAQPPSTLAAQLVENISTSTSTKSSRSSENAELKKLFTTIEHIKNNPNLLQTPEDRTSHNHMLIYVYFRAVLDALRPDDPFLDKDRMRAEASKAIHFFQLAVLETPQVLTCTASEGQYLSRGGEPLWTWAFPKVFRLLGHPQYLELSEPVGTLFSSIFKVVAANGQLAAIAPSLILYLREIVKDILDTLNKCAGGPSARNTSVSIELPSQRVFKHVDPDTSESESPSASLRRRVTYKLTNPFQCLRQAFILLSILSGPLVRETRLAGFSEHGPWLLDSLHALCNAQVQWNPPIEVAIVPLVQIAMLFAHRDTSRGNTESILQGKACIVLSFLIAELATRPAELLGDSEASKDARSCARPDLFQDGELRNQVESLCLNYEDSNGATAPPEKKRRKVTDGDAVLNLLLEQISHIVGPMTEERGLGDIILLQNRAAAEHGVFVLLQFQGKLKTAPEIWGLSNAPVVGPVASDQELNLTLLKLVEYLGSENEVFMALAFQELSSIASARGLTTLKLFEPFWRGLAHFVVKDVISRPQTSTLMADLLGISVNELLVLVHRRALPWLVLQGKNDVVERIAKARKDKELQLTIVDSGNFGQILALLLIQPVEDISGFVMAKLTGITSYFEATEIQSLLRSDLVPIALELFKLAAEGNEARKSAARNALTQIAPIVGIAGEPRARKGNVVGRFLQPHVLGLMTRLTDVINIAAFGRPATMEQRLCIQAMEEMIRTCKAHVRVARPQVSRQLPLFKPPVLLHSGVVMLALEELVSYLKANQDYLQTSAIGENPDPVLKTVVRALLDCASQYNGINLDIARLCTECIGLVGCIDSNRVEAPREQKSIVVLDNFENDDDRRHFDTSSLKYPIFCPGKSYVAWVVSFVQDLLRRPQNANASLVFEPLTRVTRLKDPSVPEFLLPYVVSHIIVSEDTPRQLREDVVTELATILHYEVPAGATADERQDMKLFYEALFRILDYLRRWVHARQARTKNTPKDDPAIHRIREFLDRTPSQMLAQRALDCEQYSRALFYLEYHMQEGKLIGDEHSKMMERLQDIYAHIDEPDGLEGLSAQMQSLDINQQVLGHRKAGRWTAAQTWYEIRLASEPNNSDVQHDLLTCLKQTGQHDVLLNYAEGMHLQAGAQTKILPFAVEASWATSRWESLSKYLDLAKSSEAAYADFDVAIGEVFRDFHLGRTDNLLPAINGIRERIAASMGFTETASLQSCHDIMLRCHILTDLELILSHQGQSQLGDELDNRPTLSILRRRLDVLGAYVEDKQYLLSIQRAAMELRRPTYSDLDISSLWMSSARLARKSNSTHQSYNAVLHASKLGDRSSAIENAKLLWKEGHHRKAIQVLGGAIENNELVTQEEMDSIPASRAIDCPQRLLKARGELLLAKWLDSTGAHHAAALREKYQKPPLTHTPWEKGHYYLGKHYKKLLEWQKTLNPDDQSDVYVTGELARVLIENYFRKQSVSRELYRRRMEQLNKLHSSLDKWRARLPAYIFYTALPQIVARIAHPNKDAFTRLADIIVKVVEAHPRQALWSLFGVMTTRQKSDRQIRGQEILRRLKANTTKVDSTKFSLRDIIRKGEKLAEQLLLACHNGDFQSNRTVKASIVRDLGFNHGCTPCPLVVPTEAGLTATLPTVTDSLKTHEAFSGDVVTIDSFLDEVLVLGSLAKPRRLTARGSDGKLYPLLIKPKDDLRTDQRLMEFNSMINRALKRDAESSKRQLYVRTYAGRAPRALCSAQHFPDYNVIRNMMREAASSAKKVSIFTDGVLGMFPPVLHLWFSNQFPDPSAWFSARIRYTRSCAGTTFAQPERVPFRLTHNMVAAMGVYGYEGPFRQCSELTLSILRQHEETLMTILEAFIYDPTLDLQKEKKPARRGDGGVKFYPQGVVDSIKRKVRGLMRDQSIPLGVEGQVDELIKQATDPMNLAAMYIGWCPFL